ncbi:hypothetical protein GLOIN_2v1485978 [Rhizophagus irregularis DAOM 181602=DAOM 197198]|uniref:HMG box domain-containing protein n=1 Tax=Rhizophagus irregularis (strain DAOM 181602 / DAOM 197198 / MUCL 43194) TaxID=747089 RepID=A0A2P4P8P8_RHIID|nr:hypothetical protein GLOIN_2v1485978 [Rhizophagus irregularis DAOM 181602=DAOM 197198]POG61766.1 hypothetical protein GLOIN_2v1485978 [Rhizophagus irregularis DAOM 181602=DAOM 197198]|eukprot:XP_025168632.1 hypothetical protein GLOIN_2v1485978 [Rhizophagus irregularis DAOM 181602=DAOM 197198]
MEKLEQFKNIDPVIVNEVDELHCKLMPSAENIEGSGPKKMDNTLVIKFIEKLNLTKIFPPEYSANKIMVKDLNKEGLPRRSMNCFFVFRHVVYLEVLEQGLIEEVKDGVFFTQVVSEMWKKLGEEDREKYKKLATEVKNLQNEYHKDKIYCKNKPAGSIFVGMHDGNFRDTEQRGNYYLIGIINGSPYLELSITLGGDVACDGKHPFGWAQVLQWSNFVTKEMIHITVLEDRTMHRKEKSCNNFSLRYLNDMFTAKLSFLT